MLGERYCIECVTLCLRACFPLKPCTFLLDGKDEKTSHKDMCGGRGNGHFFCESHFAPVPNEHQSPRSMEQTLSSQTWSLVHLDL